MTSDNAAPIAPIMRGPDADLDALLNLGFQFWKCPVHDRGRVQWSGEIATCLECGRTSKPPTTEVSAGPNPSTIIDRARVLNRADEETQAERDAKYLRYLGYGKNA